LREGSQSWRCRRCSSRSKRSPIKLLAFLGENRLSSTQRTRPASQRCAYGRVFHVWQTTSLRIPFVKPPLSVPEQLERLTSRGLIISDPVATAHYLNHIGYYRLSGYARSFQKDISGQGTADFKPGTTFEDILDRYVFDRKLRLVVMDAVERIEVSIRSALSNAIATRHGSHWYQDIKMFDPAIGHITLLDKIKIQIGYAPEYSDRRDTYIQHYYDKYSSPELPPCWMVFESVSFGIISKSYKNLIYPEFNFICKPLELNHTILRSWLHSISYIRNICAHHSRLWNRECRIKPLVAKAYKADISPNNRVYAQFVVMQILLQKIVPGNHWGQKLIDLLGEHPNIPLASMGFPSSWSSREVWRFSK